MTFKKYIFLEISKNFQTFRGPSKFQKLSDVKIFAEKTFSTKYGKYRESVYRQTNRQTDI